MSRSIPLAFLVLVFANSALGQRIFHSAVHYPVGEEPAGGVLFDYSGDGHLDLVVSTDQPDKLEFMTNFGNGVFAAPVPLFTGGGTTPVGIVTGDFDHDTDVDLLVAFHSAGAIQLMLNDGSGNFSLGPVFPAGDEANGIVAADFNDDGFLDAAVHNRGPGTMGVLLNDGAGGFDAVVHYAVAPETRGIAVGDITGDGLPDLAVTSRDSRLVRLFENVGEGVFETLIDLSLGNFLEPQDVVLARMDTVWDDTLDVITATSGTFPLQHHPSVFLQDNSGNPWVGPINGAANGLAPMGIVAADFDLDSYIDIALSNADSNNISLMRNGGMGIFFTGVTFPVGANPERLITGDVDGNGSPDLVTFNQDSNNISVLINLKEVPDVPIPGDIDADGDVDAIDSNLFVAVLLGTETNPDYVSNSDLNTDGTANGLDVSPFVTAVLDG